MFDFVPLGQLFTELSAFVAANRYAVLIMVISALICFCCKNSNAISKRTDFQAKHAVGSAVLLMLFGVLYVSGVPASCISTSEEVCLYTRGNPMKLHKWLALFAGMCVVTAALFALFNVAVDPFGVFGDRLMNWYAYDITQNPARG